MGEAGGQRTKAPAGAFPGGRTHKAVPGKGDRKTQFILTSAPGDGTMEERGGLDPSGDRQT